MAKVPALGNKQLLMPHEEHGYLDPLLCSFSVFLFPTGPAGDVIAKHPLVLCIHLMGQGGGGGGFGKDGKLQIQR